MSPTRPDPTAPQPTAPHTEQGDSGWGLMLAAFLSAFVALLSLLVGVAGVVPGLFFAALGAFGVYGSLQESRRRGIWGRVLVSALLGAAALGLLLGALRSLLTPWPFG